MMQVVVKRLLPALFLVLAVVPVQIFGVDAIERLQPLVPPGFAPGSDRTEEGLWMVMDEAEAKVSTSPNRIRDSALENYVRDTVCRLTPTYCADVRVYIIRVPEFNATMAPNGMMQVWSGLLLRMENGAQLATVLGHELGHYLRRHSLERFKRLKSTSAFLSFLSIGLSGAIQAGAITPNAGQGGALAAQMAGILSFLAHSRGDESESDRYGVQLLSDAGFDSTQSAVVWKNLIAELDADKSLGPRPLSFFMTHPLPEKRAEKLSELADYIGGIRQTVQGDAESAEYLQVIRPHLNTFLEDELDRNDPGRSVHLLERIRSTGFEPGLVTYFLGEALRARGDNGDLERASALYAEAMTNTGYPPEAHRSLGTLLLKERRYAEAREQLRTYLDHVPDAADREMMEYYLTLGD